MGQANARTFYPGEISRDGVLSMIRSGTDTFDIARRAGVREADVYNALVVECTHQCRKSRRGRKAGSGLLVLLDGEAVSVAECARRTGLSDATIRKRWRSGCHSFRSGEGPARRGRRHAKRYNLDGEMLTLSECSERLGMSRHTLAARVKRGWPENYLPGKRGRTAGKATDRHANTAA